MIRLLVGAVAAGAIAGIARHRALLSASGQWTAFALGVLAAAAGLAWAALLVAFFVAATSLTLWGADEKLRLAERTVPRGRERNALQVVANGGVYVLLALLFTRAGDARWALGALGALGAASADTWSTEVGTLLGGAPRSIATARALPIGMSGGVTVAGLVAGLGGAAFVGAIGAAFLPLPWAPAAGLATAAGFAGSVGDSLLGATLQSKRYCDRCNEWTERRVHPCGYRTRHRAGVYAVTNDVVNLLATVVGAVIALVLASYVGV